MATGAEQPRAGLGDPETRRYGRTAGLLSVGIAISGSITYLFFAFASHNLSAVEYGEIVTLWAAIFLTMSTLYRPVEQLLTRTLAERIALGQRLGSAVRVAARIQIGLALVFLIAALAARGPLEDDLLSGKSTLYWVLVVTVLAYSASYFARGYVAGTGRIPIYAMLLLFEAIVRFAFPIAVAVGVASGQETIAIGIAVAPVASLLLIPFALRRARRAGQATPPAGGDPETAEFTLSKGTGFATAVLFVMLSEQIFLNAAPLLISASTGAAAAGFIFNVLMLARAPLVVFQAVSTSLLPHLTRLRSAEPASGAEAFAVSIRLTILMVAGFAALVAAVVALAGPDLMQIAFGDEFTYGRDDLLTVTGGMGLYLVAVTLNQAALAKGQARQAAVVWIICAVAFVAWNLAGPFDEFMRAEVGFAGIAAILCAALYVLYRRPAGEGAEVLVPGSPRELEARLAAADEAG